MRCPRCDSTGVRQLPPNAITPKPGYECKSCGLRMRGPGMAIIYAVTFLLGLGLTALIAWALLKQDEQQLPRAIVLIIVGPVVAGYSLWQLLRPGPIRDTNGDN